MLNKPVPHPEAPNMLKKFKKKVLYLALPNWQAMAIAFTSG
jgi:hypothetical protein